MRLRFTIVRHCLLALPWGAYCRHLTDIAQGFRSPAASTIVTLLLKRGGLELLTKKNGLVGKEKVGCYVALVFVDQDATI
jgi:hypothetical protein